MAGSLPGIARYIGRRLFNVIKLGFGLLLITLPFLVMGFEFREWYLFHASNKWPHVTGKVTDSKVYEDSDGYNPGIIYRYSVEGHEYISLRVQFGSQFYNDMSKPDAEAYSPGTRVGRPWLFITILKSPAMLCLRDTTRPTGLSSW